MNNQRVGSQEVDPGGINVAACSPSIRLGVEVQALPLQRSMYTAGVEAAAFSPLRAENVLTTVAEKIAACSKRIAARNNEYNQQHATNTTALSSYGPGQSFDTISSRLTHPLLLDNSAQTTALMTTIDVRRTQPIYISSPEIGVHAQLLADHKLHDTIASMLLARERQSQLALMCSSHINDSRQHPQMASMILAPSQHLQHNQQLDILLNRQSGLQFLAPSSLLHDTSSASGNAFPPCLLNSQGRPRAFETFPMTLHRALAELELTPGGKNIAFFLPDGKSFQIRNQHLLEKKILPIFFPKMRSFASFQRQLNLYNFQRIGGAGFDRGSYRHEFFLRDFPAFSSQMKRTKIKGGVKSPVLRGPSQGAASTIVVPGGRPEGEGGDQGTGLDVVEDSEQGRQRAQV